jgi:2-furoyl-CoA dehydrogenase 2Fe-2S iron sulfur subunit
MPRLSADARHRIRFELNGRAAEAEAEAEPRMLLSDFLRHHLGMTGTHVGCEHGACGACTIEIDGVPARACLTLAVQADGARIHTVEGLAPEPGRLHLCRCTGYVPIVAAALDAAKRLQEAHA